MNLSVGLSFLWRQHWCSVHRCSVLWGEGHCSGGNSITHRQTITHDESFTDEKPKRWWWWWRGRCEEFSQQDGSSLTMLSLSSLTQGSSPEDKTSRFSISNTPKQRHKAGPSTAFSPRETGLRAWLGRWGSSQTRTGGESAVIRSHIRPQWWRYL